MDGAAEAFACALRILTRRDHSEHELQRKLELRGFSPSVVAGVMARLRELNYLDDRRYAVRWAEAAMISQKCLGPRLRQELTRRGIPDEIIADTIAGLAEEYDERELLAALLARKFPGFAASRAPAGEKRKVLHYLQRRGFSFSTIIGLWRDMEEC